jgi:peptidylprolyl isomerase/FKBP-type peptidyl-prolyl cis-trans isomerase FklB
MFRRIAVVAMIALSVAACHPKDKAKPPADTSANAAFLAKNAKEPGVTTLPDGLQYKIVASGPAGGEKPRAQDEVKVTYEGTLLSGDVFDSTAKHGGEPATFVLNEVIPGWTEVMQLMKPGDDWIIWIPPQLGYGEEAKGPIPGNSVLKFRVQLLGVLKHDGPSGQA